MPASPRPLFDDYGSASDSGTLDDWAKGHGFPPLSATAGSPVPTDDASAKAVASQNYTGVTLDAASKSQPAPYSQTKPASASTTGTATAPPLTTVAPPRTTAPLPPTNLAQVQQQANAARQADYARGQLDSAGGPVIANAVAQGGGLVTFQGQAQPNLLQQVQKLAPSNPQGAAQLLMGNLGISQQQAQQSVQQYGGVPAPAGYLAQHANPVGASQMLQAIGMTQTPVTVTVKPGAATTGTVGTLQVTSSPGSSGTPPKTAGAQGSPPDQGREVPPMVSATATTTPTTVTAQGKPDVNAILQQYGIGTTKFDLVGALNALKQAGLSQQEAVNAVVSYKAPMVQTPVGPQQLGNYTPGYTNPQYTGGLTPPAQNPFLNTAGGLVNPQTGQTNNIFGQPAPPPSTTGANAPAPQPPVQQPPPAAPATNNPPPQTPPPNPNTLNSLADKLSATSALDNVSLTQDEMKALAQIMAQLAIDPQMQYLQNQLSQLGAKTQAALQPVLDKIAQQRAAAIAREQARQQQLEQRLARTRLYTSPYGQAQIEDLQTQLEQEQQQYDTQEQQAIANAQAKQQIQAQNILNQIQKLTEQQGARAAQALLQLTNSAADRQLKAILADQKATQAEKAQALKEWIAQQNNATKLSQLLGVWIDTNGNIVRDQNGQPIPTVQGRKLSLDQQVKLSQLLGELVDENGQVITGANGQPIPTLGSLKLTADQQKAYQQAFVSLSKSHAPMTVAALLDALSADNQADRDKAFAAAQQAYEAEGLQKQDAQTILEFYKKYPVNVAATAEEWLRAIRAGDDNAANQAFQQVQQYMADPKYNALAKDLAIAEMRAQSQAGGGSSGKVPQIVTATLVAESRDRNNAEKAYADSPEYRQWQAQKVAWENTHYGQVYPEPPPPKDLTKYGYDPSKYAWAHQWLADNGMTFANGQAVPAPAGGGGGGAGAGTETNQSGADLSDPAAQLRFRLDSYQNGDDAWNALKEITGASDPNQIATILGGGDAATGRAIIQQYWQSRGWGPPKG